MFFLLFSFPSSHVSPPNEDDVLKGTAVRRAADNEAGPVFHHVSPRLKRERNSLCVVYKQPQSQRTLLDGKRGERQQTDGSAATPLRQQHTSKGFFI